jgi:hypothetical protein
METDPASRLYIPKAGQGISRIFRTKKKAFRKTISVSTSKLDLNLRKKPVKCHIWSTDLFGAEAWTLRKLDRKCLGSFEMWCW